MITLEDFLRLAMDNCYKINIYDTETEQEIIHQKDIDEIYDYFYEQRNYDVFFKEIQTWDINDSNNQFTLNI